MTPLIPSSIVVGHRGAPLCAIENTLYSIKKALELGLTQIEIDVQITADNQLVLHHDLHINDCLIADMTMQQVQAYKPYVPTLSQTLQVVCERGYPQAHLILDLKSHCQHHQRLLHSLSVWMNQAQDLWLPFITLASFDHILIEQLSKACPDWTYGLSFDCQLTYDHLRLVMASKVQAVIYRSSFIDQEVISICRSYGLLIYAYTVNDLKELARLKGLSVDGIITDRLYLPCYAQAKENEISSLPVQ